MKIVADKYIPYLHGIAEKFGCVTYLPGNGFTPASVNDADTLIVRSVTPIGKELLEGSQVKLVCSATIGFDHIDTEYCEANGITWKNAPGCNSGSVMQYIASALIEIAEKKDFGIKGKTIGIIGVGNVGKKVEKICRALGMNVLLFDPPRQRTEKSGIFTDLNTIKKYADIISFHTPLTKDGPDRTLHMADEEFFASLEKKPVIINSARGGIIETGSIKDAIRNGKISGTVIDCWENEPDIDREYLQMVDIATPHIAGYSADGKAHATRMALEAIATYWQLPADPVKLIQIPEAACPYIDAGNADNPLYDALLKTYSPEKDYKRLINDPGNFTGMRENYPLRREYPGYTIINSKGNDQDVLKKLGFNVA